jgi:hypothetical protein
LKESYRADPGVDVFYSANNFLTSLFFVRLLLRLLHAK